MTGFLRLAALYGVATVSMMVQRAVSRLCVYVVVGLLAVVGVAFLTAAAYMMLRTAIGEVQAAAIVGGAYLVAALIALLAARSSRR